ncbi:citrate lyase subunit beta/citryl-CoA lyase [Endobacter medicaginis]|uniref:Citrate lyase subunit beta/citryl-CoA lyase n=1 Tax=Endobacter medicaginis TaxID=1181271 RepID=A0A839UZN1_9PROT|nr:CoA ester lyase [Endobacter medicaginis]MBB3175357.1 citrate lyase subunit beta/citryl-CoA lyase [Endobacter medicaginis]MCX5476537.1 CoA ester lyase [Endobacter medicaginis]NVN29194.1 CoA ester lyase [Endobacter medicaginis]
MRLRSLLFVPGDRPDRMAKALDTGADALVLDLEDSVALGAKAGARVAVADFVRHSADLRVPLFVRVNPLGGDEIAADIAALAGVPYAALVLPKAEGRRSIEALIGLLGDATRDVRVLPIATETPAAIFELGSYREVGAHLVGLSWGAEDLPAAVGAATSRTDDGAYTAPYELARSLTLFAAHAAGVCAIDTVYPSIRDLDGLRAYAARARRDGFTGMLAIHPTQVGIINDAFTPNADDIAKARAVVAAFAARPGAGALQLDGKMIDAPHLKQATRLLELIEE